MGAGFLPEPLARPYIERGELLECQVLRQQRSGQMGYAWRQSSDGHCTPGGERALQWWLNRLSQPQTRLALLGQATANGFTTV